MSFSSLHWKEESETTCLITLAEVVTHEWRSRSTPQGHNQILSSDKAQTFGKPILMCLTCERGIVNLPLWKWLASLGRFKIFPLQANKSFLKGIHKTSKQNSRVKNYQNISWKCKNLAWRGFFRAKVSLACCSPEVFQVPAYRAWLLRGVTFAGLAALLSVTKPWHARRLLL